MVSTTGCETDNVYSVRAVRVAVTALLPIITGITPEIMFHESAPFRPPGLPEKIDPRPAHTQRPNHGSTKSVATGKQRPTVQGKLKAKYEG